MLFSRKYLKSRIGLLIHEMHLVHQDGDHISKLLLTEEGSHNNFRCFQSSPQGQILKNLA